MLIFRSVNNIVIAPASTGRERRSKIAVINTAHDSRVICIKVIFCLRILMIVVIKLMAPRMEEIPARWSEKMARSTEGPLWEMLDESGG